MKSRKPKPTRDVEFNRIQSSFIPLISWHMSNTRNLPPFLRVNIELLPSWLNTINIAIFTTDIVQFLLHRYCRYISKANTKDFKQFIQFKVKSSNVFLFTR